MHKQAILICIICLVIGLLGFCVYLWGVIPITHFESIAPSVKSFHRDPQINPPPHFPKRIGVTGVNQKGENMGYSSKEEKNGLDLERGENGWIVQSIGIDSDNLGLRPGDEIIEIQGRPAIEIEEEFIKNWMNIQNGELHLVILRDEGQSDSEAVAQDIVRKHLGTVEEYEDPSDQIDEYGP